MCLGRVALFHFDYIFKFTLTLTFKLFEEIKEEWWEDMSGSQMTHLKWKHIWKMKRLTFKLIKLK